MDNNTFVTDFRKTAERVGDKTALIMNGESMTYGELDARSGCVARKLADAGLGRGDIVTVLMNRSMDTAAAVVGVLKSGAAVCVIDAQYPVDRIEFIQSDTEARVRIDKQWMKDLPESAEKVEAQPSPSDPAIVVYTSGSTGYPKGVVNSHRALAMAYRGFAEGRADSDVMLSVASFSFIAGILEILAPMYLGSVLHIADDATRRDGELLVRYIHENGITSTFLPPQMAKFVLPRTQDQLRSLITGSDRVIGLYSDKVRVYNTYGASETCGPATRFLIDRPYTDVTPVGKPNEGSHVYVVDEEGRRVPDGETGEVCVSGQVAAGYLHLVDLTEERFVPDPFSGDGRMYRTGDLGKIGDKGDLIFIQRRDWMIKVRGYRVEPSEIESAIERLTPVRQAVVRGFENAGGETALFAAYVADEPVSAADVRNAISGFLPEYMIPSRMEQIAELPLNANGKVDRNRIEVPAAAKFRAPYAPLRSEEERRIAAVFEKVLGVENVGALDDFNILGGDSILATRAQAELPDLKLSAADILTYGTPRALGALHVPGMEKAQARDAWPLTFPERQMAAEQGMDPESVSYNINSQGLRIRGPLSEKKLQAALDELVKRHPILRSFYPMEHGEYTHRVLESMSVPIERIECSAEETARVADELNAPFNLAEAPLFRAHLFVHGKDDATLHFTFHHIIMDGTSWRAFVSDLFALYNGLDLPDLALDYFDHAVFQEEHAELEPGEAAFKEMFADGVPETEMPTVAVRPDKLPAASSHISKRVPAELIARTAAKYGVTKYELMMAALGMTLAKYTGTEDVVVGTAMSGRTMAEQDDMIGMFVNTLPVRMKPVGDMHVEDHVRRTANTIREVKKNQTYPIERLTPLLAPDRDASRSPIFDIIFNYLQKEPAPEAEGLVIEPAEFSRQALAIDLMLEALVEDENIRLMLSYSPQLYEEAVAANFMEQFLTILRRLDERDPSERVENAAELPEEQARQILEDFAGNRVDSGLGKTVTELFREQAAKTPDKKAAVFGEECLTYRQLDEQSDRLAAHLHGMGVGRGKVVGVMVRRGLMMPLASLGVLKTGAAYLPLDPAYPADRLEYMLGDAKADVIIADSDLMDRVPDFAGEWVKTEDIASLPEGEAPESPQSDDLFILLYTSGTTGNPKGVMLLHRNLVNFIGYYVREYGLTEKDNIPAYASFGFDACMMDMYPTLTSGATLHIIPEEMRLDLPGLRSYFEDNDITVAFMTTQLGRQFAERDAQKPFRALSIGGEALTPLAPPNFDFYNVYGPTECTILVTRFKIDRLYDRVPIGRALDNTALYIFDSRGHLAPVGVAGELGIAGRQVSAGYLNRPDLTEEKFVPNPYSDNPDYARMYKTGDVARFLPEGDIDFVGRRDMQVKIRGFRVELTEIEGRIREFPGIADATVVAQEDAGGGKRIVAYVVSEEVVDIAALNNFIAEKLPVYMVPAATMQIDAIPLNPNGKVDRRKLPKVTIQAEEIVEPKTDMERSVKEVVSQVLGNDEFGVTTDLMYAGLNSLSSIKAAALITEATGKKLSTTELMREKTIERIAKLLESGEDYEEKTFEKRDAYPLTANQLGLYFALVKDPASLVYNIPFELTLSPKTDVEKLKQSLEKVVNAHPYVKTRLALRDGSPVQLRNDDASVEIVVKEGSEEDFEGEKSAFVRPFNFFEGPLYDIEIFTTPEHVHLLMDFHHIIFDGGSMDVFLRDLEDAYAGRDVKSETFSSFDLALSQEEQGEEERNKARAFFAERLSDGEGATSIPADRAGEGGYPQTVRAQARKSELQDALKGLGITPSNLFLAATGLVTGRFASTDDVRIASITNGREGAQVQNILGMLVETLPTTLRPLADLSAREYLENVQSEMLQALQNRAYPYLQASSDFDYSAQILYAFQGGVISSHELEGEPFEMRPFGIDRAKFPISVNIQEDDAFFTVEAEYDDATFAEETASAYAECIAYAARTLAGALNTRLGDICVLTPAQREQLGGFNAEPEPVKGRSLTQYFERWAKDTPDAQALWASDRSYTFRELNETANRLAHALMKRGVRRGDTAAFMLPRTGNILVAMLGIMKTGAAYIPVDPEYPKERIEHILTDSRARFLLTDGERDLAGALDINALLGEESDISNPDVAVHQDDLCYIIYTSGSTGKPKGVMIEHRNIMNYVTNVPENIPDWALTQNDCSMVSVTTVSFDMFLKEAFTTLMNGKRLILSDDAQSKNPDLLAALFRTSGGNAFNATPSRMLQYMELPEIREALADCRVVMAGGEGYPSKLYEALRSVTDATLINTYGPTEITVSSNAKILDGPDITIGRPLYGVVEQVMDICGQPLPAGVTGELWIGGNGVGRGYFGNPEMTAERFVSWNERRWYKSGDLARWTQDGEIRILGRNDGQIKLRGLRIELGEIESALLAVPGVKSGAVLVRKLHGQEHLCAYYTADTQLPPSDIRDALLESLTKYMVPTAYLQMRELPMTPNGKIDRKALPEAQLMRREEYVEPANEKEKAYCEIFADILKLDRVGATDSFFDLGGTSLLVTQVTIDASEQGMKISYGDVFANPTPRELAALGQGDGGPSQEDVSGYDYAAIEKLLEENTIESLVSGEKRDLGNVCITGTTGFLGIHVLREFLRSEKGTAYCLVRGKDKETAATRLKSMLVYYFSDSFDDLFGSRIRVIPGDVTDPAVFEQLREYPIDTFINCAANVKHFSAGTDIEDVNVGGTRNAIAFCESTGCRFIQVSTASTAGMSVDGSVDDSVVMDEQMLYFGQDLGNKYAHSKFLAERDTLEAAARGLDAKIMRVGNLMAREEDGEFQANFKTNNFLGRLNAYSLIGKIPYSDLGINAEFAPIDYTAMAILALARTPKENRVFHPYNDHSIFFSDVVATLRGMGIEIEPAEAEDYERAYGEAMRDRNKARRLNSLIAYQETGRDVRPVKSVNAYTSQALLRLGFMWPITTPDYLRNFFEMMDGLGFFDPEEE